MESKYFYVNSVVKPNGVTQDIDKSVFTAYLMQSPLYSQAKGRLNRKTVGLQKIGVDAEMEDQSDQGGIHVKTEIKPYNEKGYEKSLVIVKPFSIEVYSLDGTDFKPKHTFEVYAKIWNWIKVSICTIEGREQDLLFLVTDKWEWILIYFGKGTETFTSKAVLEAADYPQLNNVAPPCFYYPGESTKLIGALLHKNLLHLIPIKGQNAEYKLSDPVTVSIGDSDIEDLTALNSYLTRSKLLFASIEHNSNPVSFNYELKVYEIEDKNTIENSNFISPFNRDLTEKFKVLGTYYSEKAIHKVVSMPFGGFLAFTSAKIMYFSADDFSQPRSTQGLFKDVSKVKWVEFIDSMPDRIQYNRKLFRMVIYTESGDLYLAVFDLDKLDESDIFVYDLSFQGKIEGGSSMSYLNEGHFIFGTSSGYFTGKLVENFTGDQSSPYLVHLRREEEWAAITNILLVDKNEYDPKELVVATQVKDNYSVINLYRRGIVFEVLLNQEVSRISYLNAFEINKQTYLIMNVARQLRIFKVRHTETNEEAKYEQRDEADEQQMNISIDEIFSETTELVKSWILKENSHSQVNFSA